MPFVLTSGQDRFLELLVNLFHNLRWQCAQRSVCLVRFAYTDLKSVANAFALDVSLNVGSNLLRGNGDSPSDDGGIEHCGFGYEAAIQDREQ